jgi:hypothetical protein
LSGGTIVGTGTASFDVVNGKNRSDYVDVFGTKLFHDKYSWKHYMINDINLSFLSKTNNPSGIMNVTFYSTMSCGNDKLFGKTPINVPEPATLSLLASGLLVFFGYNRFQRRKSISF